MTDPSLYREDLKGVGTPAEVEWLRVSGRENLYLQHTLYLIGAGVTGNVILHDWYSLSQKEEEYQKFKSEVAATMETSKQLKNAWPRRRPALRCTREQRSGPRSSPTNRFGP
ncbi:hypothetical protein Hanom_Chr03g00265491 [Helianthus anomalus]